MNIYFSKRLFLCWSEQNLQVQHLINIIKLTGKWKHITQAYIYEKLLSCTFRDVSIIELKVNWIKQVSRKQNVGWCGCPLRGSEKYPPKTICNPLKNSPQKTLWLPPPLLCGRHKLGSRDIWRIANSILNEVKFAIPPLFSGPEVLSSASDKAKLLARNFSRNYNLDDLSISLPVFLSRTSLKLHNISVTPKIVKKVITNLDSSRHLVLIVCQWWL